MTGGARTIDAVGLAVLAGVLLLGWFAVLEPLRAERAAASQRAAEIFRLADQETQTAATLEEIRDDTERLEHEMLKIRARQRGAGRGERLAELMASADAAGLTVSQVRPRDPVETGPLLRWPIELSALGRFPDAVRFVAEAPQSHPGLALQHLAIRTSGDSGDVNIQVRVIWTTLTDLAVESEHPRTPQTPPAASVD